MNAGDEFLATIRVYYTGQNTCGGGREFEDVANAVHNFDESDFDNLVPVPKQLPTEVGSIVTVESEDGRDYARLQDGGRWVVLGKHSTTFLTADELSGRSWREAF